MNKRGASGKANLSQTARRGDVSSQKPPPCGAPFLSSVLSEMHEALYQAMNIMLNEKERYALKLRYGLVDGHFYSLTEVGEVIGLTRERVRQIQARAMRKLQRVEPLRQLLDELDECLARPVAPWPAQELRSSLKETRNKTKRARQMNTETWWAWNQKRRNAWKPRRSSQDRTVSHE